MLLTHTQTDKQTNQRRQTHNLLGGGNNDHGPISCYIRHTRPTVDYGSENAPVSPINLEPVVNDEYIS